MEEREKEIKDGKLWKKWERKRDEKTREKKKEE